MTKPFADNYIKAVWDTQAALEKSVNETRAHIATAVATLEADERRVTDAAKVAYRRLIDIEAAIRLACPDAMQKGDNKT